MNYIAVPLSKMTKLTTPPSQGALLYIVDKDNDFAITFDFLSTSILNKVKIETSGLAKGGINDSSATGTINVPKASDKQAEEGVNDEVALTPFSGNKLVEAKRPKATKEQVDEGLDDTAYITSLLLNQKLTEGELINIIASSICPIGVPLPWSKDIPPDGFAIMKGQPFDPVYCPELAKIYPSNILDDMRGLALVGKEDGETIGAYEEGQVKAHGHPNSTVSSTNQGNKNTNTAGNHGHSYQWARGSAGGDGLYIERGETQGGYNTSSNNPVGESGSHTHYVSIGSHAHTVMIALFGALKNTINHRKVNWIVRMA